MVMMTTKPKVLVTVPNLGNIRREVTDKLLEMRLDDRIDGTFLQPSFKPVENNMNQIAKLVREDTFDFWITMDADNPPIKNPIDLVFLDKDVIGLPTPLVKLDLDYGWLFTWNVGDSLGDGRFRATRVTGEGLVEVEGVGLGCMVIARRVLEAIKAPFLRVWDQWGVVDEGLDYAFCRRVKAAGFKVYAHWDYCCEHWCTIELLSYYVAARKEESLRAKSLAAWFAKLLENAQEVARDEYGWTEKRIELEYGDYRDVLGKYTHTTPAIRLTSSLDGSRRE
jgi:hypothetical protein